MLCRSLQTTFRRPSQHASRLCPAVGSFRASLKRPYGFNITVGLVRRDSWAENEG